MPKPKILIVNKYHFLSGGAEKYFFKIMQALRQREIEPIPFSVNYSQTVSSPYQNYFIEPAVKNSKAKIVHMKPSWRDQLAIAGKAIYNLDAKKAVRKLITEQKPDLAYLLNFNTHISPSVIDACEESGIPVVMRMSDFNLSCVANMYHRDGHPCMDCKGGLHHGILHKCVHDSWLRSAVAVLATAIHRNLKIYHKVRAFICPSQYMRQDLMELGFPDEKVHQVNTFVKACPEKIGPDLENPYILFVGRFVPYKGTEASIRAFSKLKDLKHIRFKMVGDEGDAESARLKKIASELGENRIDFMPFERNPEKIHELTHHALFSLVPSEFYDNLPNTIIESYACGRPVIATRLGSLIDIVKEGQYGLLFQHANLEEFASKMRWLIEHDLERERMGQNARKASLTDYSEENHVERVLSIFRDVCCTSPTKASKFLFSQSQRQAELVERTA